jgi:hypothetical protein
MDAERAQALAEALHRGQRDADGVPLLDHVRRVAALVGPEARAVAWLHEVLEHTPVTEQALLERGVSPAELRALRLLTRDRDGRSDASYLGHVERIARARGDGATVARAVKRADLEDRLRHPRARSAWSPPYARGLELLANGGPRPPG